MKRQELYRWRITADGPADTLRHFTHEHFCRNFPNDCAHPTPIERTEWVFQEPETAEEEWEMWACYYRSLDLKTKQRFQRHHRALQARLMKTEHWRVVRGGCFERS